MKEIVSTRKGRRTDELRPIFLAPGYAKYADGSCFVKFGNTHVICTATLEEKVPPFLRNTGAGWITAEYGMLPCSTHERTDREAAKGRQSGRTQEIQRLIGRVLRSVVDLKLLGERQIRIDCDVIQADGGTRTASITGAYVALCKAVKKLNLQQPPLLDQVAAVSCGLIHGEARLDLDYEEDSTADVDANFVMTAQGRIVEIQATAEQKAFSRKQLDQLCDLAKSGIDTLFTLQQQALK